MKVYYDTAALERLLNEAVRAQVPALPRHWLNIGFDGSAMLISWWGVEADPATWNGPSRSPRRA